MVLVCGLSRRLNREDLMRPVLFHPVLGVGPKGLDRVRMVEYPTLARRAVSRQLEREKKQVRVIALLDTLEYLHKGGRLSRSEAVLGGLLSIKPVVAIEDGAVKVLGKARGSKNGSNLLIQQIRATPGIDFSRPLTLGYTGLDDKLLQKYIADSAALWEGHTHQLPISTIGGTIGTHVGPGAIAVAFFEK